MKYGKRPKGVAGRWSPVTSLLFVAILLPSIAAFAQVSPASPQLTISPTTPPPSAGAATPAAPTTAPPTTASSPTAAPPAEETVYLNVQDGEIRDIIKQISKATGRNFILDDKVKGKVTILSEKPMTKEEAYQTFLSALEATGFTVVRGPAGILKVVALGESRRKPIPTHIDTTPLTDSYITRLIKLDNISAQDMANALNQAELISKDGKLMAYPATNTLIITDAGSNIDRLMKIIKELDQEGPQQVLEIIPVSNASAKDIAQMVNSLFEQTKEGKPRPKPGEPEEIAEVSKIVPDERTNALIVLASKRAIEKVREIIGRLDQRLAEGNEGKLHIYFLKYAKAKVLAETLGTLTASAGQKPAAAAGAAAPAAPKIAELEGGVKVGYDEATNALLVTASAKDFRTLVDRVIKYLDIQRRQVYLEAVVMELRIDKSRRLGASGHGGAGGNVIGFGQTFSAISSLQSSLLTGGGIAGGPAPALLGGLISRQTIGINVINPADGSTKTISVPAFSAFFSALSSYGDANIISTPNLLALDNEEAQIEVRKELPVPGQQTIQANLAVAGPPTYEKAGLLLKIKPQIGSDQSVNLQIEQELSDFGPDKVINNNPVPSRIKRTVKTMVTCADGQTVVLGGLMEDQIRNTRTKVPILGDIPLLGLLFQQSTRVAEKTNLLIFITPHIVKDATDFSEIVKRKVDERNRFIQANYGKRQQEIIRESIKTHREDLLEFKEVVPDETGMTPVQPLYQPQPMTMPSQVLPPQATRQPVVTAPPLPQAPYGVGSVPLAPGVGIQPIPAARPSKGVAPSIKEQPIIESSLSQPVETPTWVKPPKAAPAAPAVAPSAPTTPQPSGVWQQIQNGTKVPTPQSRQNGLQLGY